MNIGDEVIVEVQKVWIFDPREFGSTGDVVTLLVIDEGDADKIFGWTSVWLYGERLVPVLVHIDRGPHPEVIAVKGHWDIVGEILEFRRILGESAM